MTETCWACDRMPEYRTQGGIPISAAPVGGDIALCESHWSRWITRWLNSADEPPCGAHLVEGLKSRHLRSVDTEGGE